MTLISAAGTVICTFFSTHFYYLSLCTSWENPITSDNTTKLSAFICAKLVSSIFQPLVMSKFPEISASSILFNNDADRCNTAEICLPTRLIFLLTCEVVIQKEGRGCLWVFDISEFGTILLWLGWGFFMLHYNIFFT